MENEDLSLQDMDEESIEADSIDSEHNHDEDALYDDVYQHEIGKSYIPVDEKKEFLKKSIVIGEAILYPKYKKRKRG